METDVVFEDREGVRWRVSWRPAETKAMVVGGREERFPAGLEFVCSAIVFRAPVPYRVHPKALTAVRLQTMVDRALGQ